MQEPTSTANKPIAVSIKDAAASVRVSQATIRNWIKAGHLQQSGKGLVDLKSLDDFLLSREGGAKLSGRANKLLKDTHDHGAIATSFLEKLNRDDVDLVTLADEYQLSLSESHRNAEGIYYTPQHIVEDLLQPQDYDFETAVFLDPCCGSGNFLIQAANLGFRPEKIYGYDTDPVAVAIARQRIFEATGHESTNIRVGDFLEEFHRAGLPPVDHICTNPPWGKKVPKELKERFGRAFCAGKSTDTSALFFFACLKVLKSHGQLCLLLPDAFFNIDAFKDVRLCALSRRIKRMVDYGRPFKGLMTKAVGLQLVNAESLDDQVSVQCDVDGLRHQRSADSFFQNPKHIFNFQHPPEVAAVISHLYSLPHITLAGRAQWGLGIVTGNNAKFSKSALEEGHIPVFKGADIGRNGLAQPSCFIPKDLSLYQQVAPTSLYEAEEKLIYKFISNELCFFLDVNQRYILNSANMLVLNPGFPISGRQLCDILNSEVLSWLFAKLFMTHKVLRGDLEQLPIFTEYFREFAAFEEQSFLHFLSLERGYCGAFRVKR